MNLLHELKAKNKKISVIGLGYVGMPLAVAFAEKGIKVIGYDANENKVKDYQQGIDPTNEVGSARLSNSNLLFTCDSNELEKAEFHIVAVPTPINLDKTPNLNPVISASEIIGSKLQKGSIVVYESTVYPGVTEEVCIPVLEKFSGLKCGVDFKVGYSPERINPGDKIHRLENIIKIVSGMDNESLDIIAEVYELIIEVGVHKASSIKVAEAAKVVENSQRDINIAFMNELAVVFDKMGIDTDEVVDAMNTKWNSLGFYPGLVGGHCIGVDPYYFIYQAEKLGYHSQIILSGRKINDSMGEFIGDAIIKKLILANKKVKNAKVAVMGITFKENCADTRNSKVVDIIERLNEFGINPIVVDPQANRDEAFREYGIKLTDMKEVKDLDCIVLAVSHNEFKEISLEDWSRMFKEGLNEEKVFIDVKSVLDKTSVIEKGYSYWNL